MKLTPLSSRQFGGCYSATGRYIGFCGAFASDLDSVSVRHRRQWNMRKEGILDGERIDLVWIFAPHA